MLVRLSTPCSQAENAPMRALLLLLLTFSSFSFAQSYRMTGNFTLLGSSFSPISSTYTLQWTETNGFIEGRYTDNVFATNAGVTGTIINERRTFQVVLPTPDPRRGVKSLVFETTAIGGMHPTASVSVLSKDINGAPIESTIVLSNINPDYTRVMQAQQASTRQCSTGFGALTGFCGLYGGNMSEVTDTGNLCQLTGTRLELANDGELSFFFNYNGSLRGIPEHEFGSLLGTPLTQNINTTVRHCGALPGTNLNSIGCQTLRLVGSFQDYGTFKNFSGTYDIQDEVTGNTCSFSMTLVRDVVY